MNRDQKTALLASLALLIIATALWFFMGHSKTTLSSLKQQSDKSLADYYAITQGNTPRNLPPQTVTFLATGDIMLSRNIALAIQKAQDANLPFEQISDLLRSTDFNFANLESPFSGSSKFNLSGSMVFNAPPDNIKGVVDYNFKVLNLANNHAMDQGLTGIDATRKILDDNGILHIGTGDNLNDAWQPQILTIKGVRIGFIGSSYASNNHGGKATNNYVARIEDLKHLKAAIDSLKANSDFVVVTMHAGIEYTRTPDKEQVDFAHAAIDDGADIVIGAHPHWVQTTELYNGKYIFYSLGNFVFDQPFSQDTKEGLTLKITLDAPGSTQSTQPGAATINDLQGQKTNSILKQIELVPVIIENNCCPRPADQKESDAILKKIDVANKLIP